MRILAAVTLAACTSTAGTVTVTAKPSDPGISIATTPPGIACGGAGAECEHDFAYGTEITIDVTNSHPENNCYFWGCGITPATAGTCTVTGRSATAMLTLTEPITVAAGGCYNP